MKQGRLNKKFWRITLKSFFDGMAKTIEKNTKGEETSASQFLNSIQSERRINEGNRRRTPKPDRRKQKIADYIEGGSKNQTPGTTTPQCSLEYIQKGSGVGGFDIFENETATLTPTDIWNRTKRDISKKRERDNSNSPYYGITIPTAITYYTNQLPKAERKIHIPRILEMLKCIGDNQDILVAYIDSTVSLLRSTTKDTRPFIKEYIPTIGLIDSKLQEHIEECHSSDIDYERATGGVGLVYCDINAFKPVNDNQGHATGDIVISESLAWGKKFNGIIKTMNILGLKNITFAGFGSGDESAHLVECEEGYQLSDISQNLSKAINEHFYNLDLNTIVCPFTLTKYLHEKNTNAEDTKLSEDDFWKGLEYKISMSIGFSSIKQALEAISSDDLVKKDDTANDIIVLILQQMKDIADKDGQRNKNSDKANVLALNPPNDVTRLAYNYQR